jgi:hypothetical protein
MRLSPNGKQLLVSLVRHLQKARPGRPETYVTYKQIHDELRLEFLGDTYGDSLKHQGLADLAEWTKYSGYPAITGLVVSGDSRMPGHGYFELYGRTEEEFGWWADEIAAAKAFNWTSLLS